jgi:Protein of unknown function (DUF3365)
MTGKLLPALLGAGVMLAAVLAGGRSEEKSHKLTTISPGKMADALHAIIAADRQAYAELIVQRLDTDEHRLAATVDWRQAHALPVHAQMLHAAAQSIQKEGAEFSYTLRSLWPLNRSNGPQTQAEQTGLEFVTKYPDQIYSTEELLGGRSYFTAVYPDRATLPSCVQCHNQNPGSPRHDFKLNEVMGAIVVRVPLEF